MRPTQVFSYERQVRRSLSGPSPTRLRLMAEKWFDELVWAWADLRARLREAQKQDLSTLVSAGVSRRCALRVMGPVHIFRCKRPRQDWNEHPANVLKRVRGRCRRLGRLDMFMASRSMPVRTYVLVARRYRVPCLLTVRRAARRFRIWSTTKWRFIVEQTDFLACSTQLKS